MHEQEIQGIVPSTPCPHPGSQVALQQFDSSSRRDTETRKLSLIVRKYSNNELTRWTLRSHTLENYAWWMQRLALAKCSAQRAWSESHDWFRSWRLVELFPIELQHYASRKCMDLYPGHLTVLCTSYPNFLGSLMGQIPRNHINPCPCLLIPANLLGFTLIHSKSHFFSLVRATPRVNYFPAAIFGKLIHRSPKSKSHRCMLNHLRWQCFISIHKDLFQITRIHTWRWQVHAGKKRGAVSNAWFGWIFFRRNTSTFEYSIR